MNSTASNSLTAEDNGQDQAYRPMIGISIVNYRSLDATRSLLGDIADFDAYVDLSVVVVDNSAYELPVASRTLRGVCDSVTYRCEYLPKDNLGYAAGTNAAIAALAGSDVDGVWVLNSDVRLDPSGAAALCEGLSNSREAARVFATTLRDPVSGVCRPGISGINLLTTTTGIAGAGTIRKAPRWYTIFPEGYSFIMTRAALALLQHLEDNHFLFYEEVELMTRASRCGIGVDVLPGVLVEHTGGVATGSIAAISDRSLGTLYHVSRSCVLFYGKHHPYLLVNCVLARCLQAVQLCVARKPALAMAVLRGVLAGLSTIVQRRRESGSAGRARQYASGDR